MHIFLTGLSQATTLIMAGVCLLALLIGRWPERASSLALAANWIGCALGEDRRPHHHGQPVVLALDIALAIFILFLAAGWRRTWLLWMAAFLVLVVMTHFAAMTDVRLTQWSYQTAYYIWSMGVLLSLGVGSVAEGRRPAVRLLQLA